MKKIIFLIVLIFGIFLSGFNATFAKDPLNQFNTNDFQRYIKTPEFIINYKKFSNIRNKPKLMSKNGYKFNLGKNMSLICFGNAINCAPMRIPYQKFNFQNRSYMDQFEFDLDSAVSAYDVSEFLEDKWFEKGYAFYFDYSEASYNEYARMLKQMKKFPVGYYLKAPYKGHDKGKRQYTICVRPTFYEYGCINENQVGYKVTYKNFYLFDKNI